MNKPVSPRDEPAFALEILLAPDGLPRYRLLSPDDALSGRVTSREELLQELAGRQHNALTMHAGTVGLRRWHMERERPALRWFCRHFGVPVPGWLQGNGGYDELSPASYKELFGNAPLRPVEFRSWGELMNLLPPKPESKKMA